MHLVQLLAQDNTDNHQIQRHQSTIIQIKPINICFSSSNLTSDEHFEKFRDRYVCSANKETLSLFKF